MTYEKCSCQDGVIIDGDCVQPCTICDGYGIIVKSSREPFPPYDDI